MTPQTTAVWRKLPKDWDVQLAACCERANDASSDPTAVFFRAVFLRVAFFRGAFFRAVFLPVVWNVPCRKKVSMLPILVPRPICSGLVPPRPLGWGRAGLLAALGRIRRREWCPLNASASW